MMKDNTMQVEEDPTLENEGAETNERTPQPIKVVDENPVFVYEVWRETAGLSLIIGVVVIYFGADGNPTVARSLCTPNGLLKMNRFSASLGFVDYHDLLVHADIKKFCLHDSAETTYPVTFEFSGSHVYTNGYDEARDAYIISWFEIGENRFMVDFDSQDMFNDLRHAAESDNVRENLMLMEAALSNICVSRVMESSHAPFFHWRLSQ